MTTVSTIIPAYNAARYLREAIESALAQDGVSQEIIVVDDGSTDGTPDVIASYGDQIISLRQANSGPVVARNQAARVATGEWLAFLDADDCWEHGKLSRQLDAASGAAIVYTERLNVGAIERVASRQSECCDLPEGEVFELLLQANFITASSVLIQREWFERLGGFCSDTMGCEDWDLWLQCSALGGRVAVIREPLTRYRIHPDSLTSRQDLMCRSRRRAVERALATPLGKSLGPAIAKRARAMAWSCSAWHAMATWRWTSLAWFMRSATYDPWNLEVYKNMVKCVLHRG